MLDSRLDRTTIDGMRLGCCDVEFYLAFDFDLGFDEARC